FEFVERSCRCPCQATLGSYPSFYGEAEAAYQYEYREGVADEKSLSPIKNHYLDYKISESL
ncbi:hypothetical protein ACO1MX_14950, partial [Staphylococcus aureus]